MPIKSPKDKRVKRHPILRGPRSGSIPKQFTPQELFHPVEQVITMPRSMRAQIRKIAAWEARGISTVVRTLLTLGLREYERLARNLMPSPNPMSGYSTPSPSPLTLVTDSQLVAQALLTYHRLQEDSTIPAPTPKELAEEELRESEPTKEEAIDPQELQQRFEKLNWTNPAGDPSRGQRHTFKPNGRP